MSVAVASRLVEERNSSRNCEPSARPVGLRLQSGGTMGVGPVNLMLTAVPAVQEKPGLNHSLLRAVGLGASARAREVPPTTTVRALVAAVMSVSRVNVKAVALTNKVVTE